MARRGSGASNPSHLNPVAAALESVRKAPRRVRRQSRDAIRAAVRQLVDAAAQQPSAVGGSGEYRIDDLARRAGTTTRNVRAYRERGLLPPPRRVGRVAFYDESHVARLTLIASMLDRGYSISHVREMLTAWEEGKELGDVLGIEKALVGKWTEDRPVTMTVDDVRGLAGDQHALDRLVALGLVRIDGTSATVTRPKLLDAFREMREYGLSTDLVLDVHEKVTPRLEEISRILVEAGALHVAGRFDPKGGLPDNTDIAELVTMLVQFRSLALTSVTETLAASIETTIESVVGDFLAKFVLEQSDEDAT
ncbi:MerR family transcriptional regulator [Antrihabitans stalactiti]|uniref:MerR family transcriptional regulator n=1 Tax=Antrihabitans stalactiti TaxID=2584121 RepID=A0A848K767_9NOCA|nr:MerR family transcriptional regulator [Antrihabitans stalactiti]